MNDVLKSLYSQAVIHTANMFGKAHADGPRNLQKVVNEKFAQLIIQECCNIVNNLEGVHNPGDCSTVEYIKEHFGVTQ